MDKEIPLDCGNVAQGVVRVGNTIRKPVTPHTPATKALLDALEIAKVEGVPRFIQVDNKGRQSLDFVEGDTAFPPDMWTSDAALISSARLLRTIHDATIPLRDQGLPWAYHYPDKTQHDIIGHSDFAPYNMTFAVDGSVNGIFDFDLAGPAPRLRDLAYLAWWMVPLGQQDPSMATATTDDLVNQSQRLKHLCATYGVDAHQELLDMIDHVLHHMSDPDITTSMIGEAATAVLIAEGHLDHWAKARDDFATIQPKLIANLGL